MADTGIRQIQRKLESLFDVISQITPTTNLVSHNYNDNSPYIDDLLTVLDTLISKANIEKDIIIKEIQRIESDILLFSSQLNLGFIELPIFENLGLHREYVENELNKILFKRSQVESEIKILVQNICELSKDVSDEPVEISKYFNSSTIISIETVELLKNEKSVLLQKITELEIERQSFYDIIVELSKQLCKETEISFSENICDLKRKMNELQNEFKERKESYEKLLDEIKKRENLLNFEKRLFEYSLDQKRIEEIREYNDFLIKEQNRLFDEIYNRTIGQLKEIDEILGKENVNYLKSEESLLEMRKRLDKYENIKDKHDEIVDLLKRRRSLLERMTEFEILASDPKRLFKSSFQLNSEEKFRNSAYPSLLKIEESLFDKIESFEENYGEFVHEKKPYKLALKHEIENRIINRTVFISRCDSPFRKKR